MLAVARGNAQKEVQMRDRILLRKVFWALLENLHRWRGAICVEIRGWKPPPPARRLDWKSKCVRAWCRTSRYKHEPESRPGSGSQVNEKTMFPQWHVPR